MKKNKTGIALVIIGNIIMSVAGIWIVSNINTDNTAKKLSADLLEKVIENTDESVKELSENMPIVKVDGDEFCGRVIIDKLDIELPVYNDWSYEKLQSAPCRYKGSLITEDIIIAAHNYESHFGNIGSLNENDEVVFVDVTGKVHKYSVEQITKLDGTDVESMTSGKWEFTLFTCTFDGSQRVTVCCEKI